MILKITPSIICFLLAFFLLFSDVAQAATIGKSERRELRQYACISYDAEQDKDETIKNMTDRILSQYYEDFQRKFYINGFTDKAEKYAQDLLSDMKPKFRKMAQDIYDMGTLDNYCTDDKIKRIKNNQS